MICVPGARPETEAPDSCKGPPTMDQRAPAAIASGGWMLTVIVPGMDRDAAMDLAAKARRNRNVNARDEKVDEVFINVFICAEDG